MRYLMTFTYDGSKYNGYQKQRNAITIQEELESALTKINSNNEVKLFASGRTDAGVHALQQKAHFDLDRDINEIDLKKAINSIISNNIYIISINKVANTFHARFNVKKKEYIYKINIGEYNPLEKDYIYQYNKELDIILMKQAIKRIEGTHDFRSFTKVEEEKDFIRTIYKTKIDIKKDIIIIHVIGNGFLRYMVRNIVGLLIEIGCHKKNIEDIDYIINSRDRTKAGFMAPPQGLYLKEVIY